MRILFTVLALEAAAFVGFISILQFESVFGRWVSIVAFLVFFAFGLAVWFVRCPTCKKPVLVREKSSFRYTLPFPEVVCSRCGTKLVGAPHPGHYT
jgi:endogenous inhibitor of DNA gyrase (YacG/DUF329 family)